MTSRCLAIMAKKSHEYLVGFSTGDSNGPDVSGQHITRKRGNYFVQQSPTRLLNGRSLSSKVSMRPYLYGWLYIVSIVDCTIMTFAFGIIESCLCYVLHPMHMIDFLLKDVCFHSTTIANMLIKRCRAVCRDHKYNMHASCLTLQGTTWNYEDGRSSNHGVTLTYAFGFIVLTVTLSVMALTVGLFMGYSFNSLSIMRCSKTFPSALMFNWGDKVNINGQKVEVINWFDDIMTADNIKNNIK